MLRNLLTVILLLPVVLSAQNRIHFTSLNQSNGLISGDVMCFRQDTNGFMWIGTKYGLNIYDGLNFSVYGIRPDPPFNSDISCLAAGKGNDMWIGTLGEGLFLYRSLLRSSSVIPLFDGSDSVRNVECVLQEGDTVWAGTEAGLFRIIQEKAQFIPLDSTRVSVTALVRHGKGLLAGTKDKGLLFLDENGKVKSVEMKGMQINCLLPVSDTLLLAGTQTSGLYFIRSGQKSSVIKCPEPPFNTDPIVNDMLVDRNGDLWIGTDGSGLIRMKPVNGTFHTSDHITYDGKAKSSIPSNAVFSLYEDKQGNIWIGTIWKGLSIMNSSPANSAFYFSDLTGDEPYPVLSVFRDGKELWLGTDGNGLSIIDLESGRLRKISTLSSPALKGEYVQQIFRDSKGLFWIGTFSSGLFCYDRKRESIREFSHNSLDATSISYNDIRTILEDRQSDLWICTWGGGLNRYSRKNRAFTSFRSQPEGEADGVTDNITSACFNTDSTGIWTGTFGNGLYLFDLRNKSFSRPPVPSFRNLKILSVYPDSRGKLWIGTWGNGLKVYDISAQKEDSCTALEQISSLRVTAIREDRYGMIWFSSKNGIFRYDPGKNALQKFGGFDLITNKEFHINSAFSDDDGNIWFGGIEGVVEILPSEEIKTGPVPPPVITDFRLYSGKLPGGYPGSLCSRNTIRLAWNQNYFTLFFSTPWFPVSDITYSFMMENLNDNWISVPGDMATFTSLSPGTYIFRVRSSFNNADWSSETRYTITITQPYWKRWWAYLIYVSLFVGLLFLFQKYTRDWEGMKANLRLETLEREKENELHQVKQRFFTNISHEIRTPVSLILGATERLNESGLISKGYQREVEAIRNSSRHLIQLINELLDFRRLESDGIKIRVAEGDFLKFSKEIFLSFQAQASIKNIEFRFISGEEKIRLWYDRVQMEKVLYNLISNAFKYTPEGGNITLELEHDDQFCYFRVTDSGKGIPDEQLYDIFKRFYQSENAAEIRESGFGLGLSIAKEIVSLHGGEIGATNNAGQGICIAVKLPKGNSQFPAEQQVRDFKNSEQIENYLPADPGNDPATDFGSFGEVSLLIVEDNDYLRDYLQALFPPGFIISTASDGEEGLKKAIELIPDLIISDVMMPVMDGVAMTRAIKTNIQTSHIPVVLLTARTNLIYKREGYDVGADDYITKPFNQGLLKTRVHNILKSRKQFREKLLKDYITRPQDELNISTPDQQFLSRLTDVIERNIHENEINARLLADELGMSHSVIYKKIKALTGLSLIEFIRDFKLKRAAVLLSKYRMNITDVCYKVGFSDRRYFSKLFKIKYGVPPSEFIRHNRDGQD
ncbi:MAG: two-component regulator propeller domain-containing protein [Bacteroidota bacterium]